MLKIYVCTCNICDVAPVSPTGVDEEGLRVRLRDDDHLPVPDGHDELGVPVGRQNAPDRASAAAGLPCRRNRLLLGQVYVRHLPDPRLLDVVDDEEPARGGEDGHAGRVARLEDPRADHLEVLGLLAHAEVLLQLAEHVVHEDVPGVGDEDGLLVGGPAALDDAAALPQPFGEG